MARKTPTRSTRLFTEAGWCACSFRGKPARRGPNGWVCVREEGEWTLYRDTHYTTAYFATYNTVSALLKDVEVAMHGDRTRKGETRPLAPRMPTIGAWQRKNGAILTPSDRWADNDPRWG